METRDLSGSKGGAHSRSGYVSELDGDAGTEALTLLHDAPAGITQLPRLDI